MNTSAVALLRQYLAELNAIADPWNNWASMKLVLQKIHALVRSQFATHEKGFVGIAEPTWVNAAQFKTGSSIDNTALPGQFATKHNQGLAWTYQATLRGFVEGVIAAESLPTPATTGQAVALDRVVTLCRRFPDVARQIRRRHGQRPTLEVQDEYDVQDLLHSMLLADFDDVRAEEHTPSYAAGSSRMDFLLKKEQLVIEVKMMRRSMTDREAGDQLAIDIQRYSTHPDCKILVCFVFVPDGAIRNPRGFERDLTKDSGELRVVTIVAPS